MNTRLNMRLPLDGMLLSTHSFSLSSFSLSLSWVYLSHSLFNLSIYLSIYLSISLSLSLFLSIHHLSIYLYIYLSIYLSSLSADCVGLYKWPRSCIQIFHFKTSRNTWQCFSLNTRVTFLHLNVCDRRQERRE